MATDSGKEMIYAGIFLFLLCIFLFWHYPALRKTWYWLPHLNGLVVFMYHHIGTLDPSDEQYAFTISPEMFEKQLLFLKQYGYTLVAEKDVVRAKQEGTTTVKKPVLLTFDDGHADNYTELFPLVKKYKIPVLIFLITDKIGTKGYLSWEQILEMHQSGFVSFGSHSCSHRRLRSLPNEEIIQEARESKRILEEKLQTPIYGFCYPFGAGGFDKRVRPLILESGYTLDYSTKKGINAWPYRGKKSLLRAFPRGGEDLWDYHLQLTRGRSKL